MLLNSKHPSQLVLKKKVFEYFISISMVLTLDPLARGHLGTWDLHLNKLGKKTTRQCYIPNFKHLSQVVQKKKIF